MKQIRFLKPFSSPNEGEMITSIVAYKKTPWIIKTRPIKEDPTVTSSQTHEEVVVQYRCRLHINLWLVVMKFSWYSPAPQDNK